ncbi:CII family transcriptional regulator [Escherichia coli]|uniref:CII family transcriptional regulator n=1 Tax=Escherichia coli TaxID=562 RepID=UPI000BCE5941|nr:CII family transcriptional regulator [Escherichia coli]PAC17582.1 hypothetical protein CDH62_18570 [Escherichia coli]
MVLCPFTTEELAGVTVIPVPEYQVSRWKNGFFSQVSMMLAVLEYGIEDDEMADVGKP